MKKLILLLVFCALFAVPAEAKTHNVVLGIGASLNGVTIAPGEYVVLTTITPEQQLVRVHFNNVSGGWPDGIMVLETTQVLCDGSYTMSSLIVGGGTIIYKNLGDSSKTYGPNDFITIETIEIN